MELEKVMNVVVGVEKDTGRGVGTETQQDIVVKDRLRNGAKLHVRRGWTFKGHRLRVDI